MKQDPNHEINADENVGLEFHASSCGRRIPNVTAFVYRVRRLACVDNDHCEEHDNCRNDAEPVKPSNRNCDVSRNAGATFFDEAHFCEIFGVVFVPSPENCEKQASDQNKGQQAGIHEGCYKRWENIRV